MESIKEIFKIGKGPSSSHTMGPRYAAQIFKDKNPEAARFEVTLFGSLASTGKGHLTDVAILETLGADRCDIIASVIRRYDGIGRRAGLKIQW